MAIGKVIKGDVVAEPPVERATRPPRPGVLSAEDYEARQVGNKIIDEAKAKAEEIVAEAERERERILADAKEQGRQEGLAECAEQLARAKLQAGQILASDATEREVLSLALKIAEKIVGRDLERHPDVIAEICANAIDQVRSARAVTLRVHPSDGQRLRAIAPKMMELIARSVDVAVKDDGEVEPGGCIVQTEFGIIDAQLQTQFEMIRHVLLSDDAKKEGPA